MLIDLSSAWKARKICHIAISLPVFSNLFKYSIRALKRQKAHVIINVVGLSVGMVCSMVIALLTISYRALRTARMNPVNALRYE